MSVTHHEIQEVATPNQAEAQLAQESSQRLAKMLRKHRKKTVHVRVEAAVGANGTLAIPVAAFRLLNGILSEMGKGNAVTLLPVQAELTTQQAADLLGVSRPFLVEQLEKRAIPFRKVGSHRRVRVRDLMSYKKRIDRKRLRALDKLSALDQELGLGY